MHVFIGVDDTVALPVTVCIASLLNSSTNDERFHFHFAGELSELNFDKILYLSEMFRPFFVDFVEFEFLKFDRYKYITCNKKIILKLFVSELFPQLNRVLWLDCEILVLKNIREIYEMNLDEKYFAAVDVCPSKRRCFKGSICNVLIDGGVQLFNLKLMREVSVQEQWLKYTRRNVKGRCVDESTLVFFEPQKILILSGRCDVYLTDFCRGKQICTSEIVILHFLNKKKPWEGYKKTFIPQFFEMYKAYMEVLGFEPQKQSQRRKMTKKRYQP